LGVVKTMKNNHENNNARPNQHFSIRKFSIGAASITLGTCLFLNAEHQAQAAENAVEPAHSAVASESNTPAQSKPVAPTVETNAQPNADHTDKTVATTTTNDKSRAQANDKQTVTPATNVSNTTQPKAAPAPTALTTNAVNPKSSTAVSNPAKQAVDQSIKDAVKDKTYTNKPHDTSNSRPVSFEMKNKDGDLQFYHYASTISPANVYFNKDKNKTTVELGLKTASTWKKFEVYENNKKLPIELVTYNPETDDAYIRFDVSNGTKELVIKSSTQIYNDPETNYDYTKMVFEQPIYNDESKFKTREDFETEALLADYNKAKTLERKIYELNRVKDQLPEKLRAQYSQKLEQLKKDLDQEVASAKVEFEHAPVKKVQITNSKSLDISVLQSDDDDLSTMDGFVEKPFELVEVDGKKYIKLTTTIDSIWKDFQVEGQRVMTIDKDTVNDKRTVLFPYVEGKEIYNSIVKVDFPTIGYSGQYHVRIKNNAISKKADAEAPTTPNNKKDAKPDINQADTATSNNKKADKPIVKPADTTTDHKKVTKPVVTTTHAPANHKQMNKPTVSVASNTGHTKQTVVQQTAAHNHTHSNTSHQNVSTKTQISTLNVAKHSVHNQVQHNNQRSHHTQQQDVTKPLSHAQNNHTVQSQTSHMHKTAAHPSPVAQHTLPATGQTTNHATLWASLVAILGGIMFLIRPKKKHQ